LRIDEINETNRCGMALTERGYLIALEGGGTRSQATLLDGAGNVLCTRDAAAVNTNFVALDQAQRAVQSLIHGVLQAGGISGRDVTHFATSLVGLQAGAETFGSLCPRAEFHDFPEMRVVFARAGIYQPHGVSLVAATGATTWGVRRDDGREVVLGGWGSLLGDEGSAYALGLVGLRGAVLAFEQRAPAATGLVEAVSEYFHISPQHFRDELVPLVYQTPLGRTEIAAVAPLVTRLAGAGDPLAQMLTAGCAADLAALVLSAAGRLFTSAEGFDVVMAGGMVNAGEVILNPLKQKLLEAFPLINFTIGSEPPATALGRLLLHTLEEKAC
jgi:N-acetylglucosamine kinase-like BadF-type ATPase